MELIHYLNTHFLTEEVLLEKVNVNYSVLEQYQLMGVMPKASYQLKLAIQCDSFFGQRDETRTLRYYAKGYVSWFQLVQTLLNSEGGDKEAVYSVFFKRYVQAIDKLKGLGHGLEQGKVAQDLHLHVEQEWVHFLEGTYGLCTLSGLPEDIAAKELAISQINGLSQLTSLTSEQRIQLTRAVNLLDDVSALFAPHERASSSRKRLVDDIREAYQLSA
ncbi:DUF6058 family natural product biosynthesis protein [uncultured Shewanella sp.]|uniref:DUF6058 family natural product biosynthesis protein n=1 Tax=uncultured Shewanella sp. TaxID=173975 RepID=UPI002629C6A8|nr:DUF6058 family natural product biosynthesis protein [uncultured Shewanella sp.]